MSTGFAETDVQASFTKFVDYLASYKIKLSSVAPKLAVVVEGTNAKVTGLPVIDGVATLDLTKRKVTRRLPLPLGLECGALLCGETKISGIDNLPDGLHTLILNKNSRFKRWPTGLPASLKRLDVSFTELVEVGDLPARLETLDCSNNKIETLGVLPETLKELKCPRQLRELPNLPPGLEVLSCKMSGLDEFPEFPETLRKLEWTGEHTSNPPPKLSPLPDGLSELRWFCSSHPPGPLPDSLRKLSGSFHEGIELPPGLKSAWLYLDDGVGLTHLPDSMEELVYSGSAPLPALPDSLVKLRITQCDFHELPSLPTGLKSLAFWQTELTSLPELPSGLVTLYCPRNSLMQLPALPDSITELNVSENQLTSLPELPKSLSELRCDHNQLTDLPRLDRWWDDIDTTRGGYSLDQGLRHIECQHNQITAIPTLPKGLDVFRCQNNQITEMPPMPVGLRILNCANNKLERLESLPAKLNELYCSNNRQLAVIDTYSSEQFDRMYKSNATKTNLDDQTKERLRSWRVRVD